jgi:two-component system, chemotaxis family, response regulator Rcp1
MTGQMERQPVEILLVEDNPGDIRLARMALANAKIYTNLNVVMDGEEAMAFLRREGPYANSDRPDLILLDLNLPRKSGLEVLQEIKHDEDLKTIPVVVLTTSDDEKDILSAYREYVNCYIIKPMDFNQFLQVVKNIEDFWLTLVKLPPESKSNER